MICFTGRSDITFSFLPLRAAHFLHDRDVYALMNCTSSVIVTSSPTRMPPVSSAAFHVSPKSLRLIFVVAESPIRVLPQGSLPGAVGPSTLNNTLRVTP